MTKTSIAPAQCCAPLTGAGITEQDATTIAGLFKALSDPTRVRIVNLLATSPEPVCLCELNEEFALTQPTMSHHLKKLVSSGLLRREQRGTWAYYSIESAAFDGLANTFSSQGDKR